MNEERLSVSHVNIRTSISLLLLKLLFIEIIAATFVLLLHSSIFFFDGDRVTDALGSTNIQLFSMPIYIVFVVIKTALTIYVILQWLNEYYEITPSVIFHRKGLIFKSEEKFPFIHIGLVELNQSFFGRMFNFGTISLFDKRRNKYADMYLIHNPSRYIKVIEEIIPGSDEKKHLMREHFIEKDVYDTD